MSKPATTARRKATRAKHKAKMRKRAQQRARMEAARATTKAQGCSTGASVMEPNENLQEAPQTAAASEEPNTVTEATSGEVIEQEQEHTEEQVTEQTAVAGPDAAPAAIQEPIENNG